MTKRFLFLVLAVVLNTAGVFAQPFDADFYIRRAEQYRNQDEWDRAMDMYNTVLTSDPDNIRALNGRGVIYQKRGDLLKAKADFQYAYDLNPSAGPSKHNLDGINERLREMEIMSGAGALGTNVEYRDAVRILGTSDYGVIGAAQPTNAKVSNMQTTSSSGAAAQPVSSMTVSSSTTTVSSSMTGAYQQSGIPVYQTPAPAQTNATVIPSRQTPLVPSIMIRSQESSRANSERMLTPPPRNPEIRTPAQATAPQGSSGGLLSLRYDSATVLNNRGVSLNTAGYYERAVLEYTDAIARNPNFAVAFNNRGVAYANLGQYDRALDDFNQALRLNPYYYDAMANREQVKVSLASR